MERNSAPRLSLDCPSTELVFDKQFVHEIHAVVFVVENGTPSSSDRLASNIVCYIRYCIAILFMGMPYVAFPLGRRRTPWGSWI